MDSGKPSCAMGLQLSISKKDEEAPPPAGVQGFKFVDSPVGVPFATPLFTLFRTPSFVNSGGGGSCTGATMKQHHLEASQGDYKLSSSSTTPDDDRKNKKQLPENSPISGGKAGVLLLASSSSEVPSNSDDQTRSQRRSKWDRNLNNSNMDPKRLKRILSNRLSAQKSRQKKFQYIDEMERKVKALEAEIALLTPQVAVQEHQVALLKMENNFLNKKLASVDEKNGIKDAVVEQKREEVKRLKDIYRLQQRQLQVRGMLGWKIGFI